MGIRTLKVNCIFCKEAISTFEEEVQCIYFSCCLAFSWYSLGGMFSD